MSGNDGANQLQACVARFSRLAADGTTPAGATNAIVTSGLISLDYKVVTESGVDFTTTNGCGNIAFTYKEADKFKRLDGTLKLTTPDVEAAEMLTGGSLITSGGSSIGFAAPAVGSSGGPGVCLELWAKAKMNDGSDPPGVLFTDGATTSGNTTVTSASAAFTALDVNRTITGAGIPAGATIVSVTNSTTIVISASATATATGVSITIGRPGSWWRYVFPKFLGSLSDNTLDNSVANMTIVGPMLSNANVGNGPNNDFPSSMPVGRAMAYFRDAAPPSSSVGYVATPTQT